MHLFDLQIKEHQAQLQLAKSRKNLYEWLIAQDFSCQDAEEIALYPRGEQKGVEHLLSKAETTTFRRMVATIARHERRYYLTFNPHA